MAHSFFISYSRQEAPFVDALLDTLEDEGNQVWVDYRSLTPGKPWLDQIYAGVEAAEIVLLVVSKSSISSGNVAEEYQHALEKGKRILLAIVEATPLPAELRSCAWVDFRGPFKDCYKNLMTELHQPKVQQAAPQSGFKAPAIVWLSFFASLLTLIISIPSWWTLFMPLLLIPLPFQIISRKVNYYRVRFALIILPVALFATLVFEPHLTYVSIFPLAVIFSLAVSPVMLFLISSNGMRIWGKPGSSTPKFANPYVPDNTETMMPSTYYMEYAPEDKKYADAIIQQLDEFYHSQVTEVKSANVCFVILSRYKNTVSIDPQKHVLYPVIIQDAPLDDPRIQRIQWIDFRRGLRNLDSLAMLLPQPMKMLKALGAAPFGRQTLHPRIIQILDYYLTLLGFFSISIWLPLGAQLGSELRQHINLTPFIAINIFLTSAILMLAVSARRALVNRAGRLASISGLILTNLAIGMIAFVQMGYVISATAKALKLSGAILPIGQAIATPVITFLPCSFILGAFVIFLLCLWNWRDLTRWFPYRGK
jgi:hypothetical protein